MSKHKDFILSPITDILKEVSSANAGIGNGIETYPLSEYILQSVFLQMTGFQEQKLKCICWELATNDYEYRYLRFTQDRLGECSDIKEKSKVYIDLINEIKKRDINFNVTSDIDKNIIRESTISDIREAFTKSNLSSWSQRSFLDFINEHSFIRNNQFLSPHALFESDLVKIYQLLHKHRNRTAHNLLSYQENLPTLKTLLNTDYKYDNYIVRFSVLILIDKIFIELYKKYSTILSNF